MSESVTMLTTIDNPFSPFTEFEEWFAFDIQKGYNTCALLDRVVPSRESLDEEDELSMIESAKLKIVQFNTSGRHVLVTKDSFKRRSVPN
jgi:hypothetical protein